MNLNDLTKEQRDALYQEMKLEEKRKSELKENERRTYKDLVSKQVEESIKELEKLSTYISIVKGSVFQKFSTLLSLKKELYEVESNQQSHTFTNKEGNIRITMGYRVLERFDDTVNEGISRVRNYMDGLAKDEQSAQLLKIINNLLKRDKLGNLKANRVLELQNYANEIDSKELKEAVEIIMQAYRPEQSAYFISADVKNEVGGWQSIGLSVSGCDFPSDFNSNF